MGLNCEGTCNWKVFNRCTAPCIPGFCIWGFIQLQNGDSIFILQLVVDVVQDYIHCSVPFYIKGFEYPWILVSTDFGIHRVLKPILLQILMDDWVLEESKVIHSVWLHGGCIPNHHVVQGSVVLLRYNWVSWYWVQFTLTSSHNNNHCRVLTVHYIYQNKVLI